MFVQHSLYIGDCRHSIRVRPGPIDGEMFSVWVTIVLAQDVRVNWKELTVYWVKQAC